VSHNKQTKSEIGIDARSLAFGLPQFPTKLNTLSNLGTKVVSSSKEVITDLLWLQFKDFAAACLHPLIRLLLMKL